MPTSSTSPSADGPARRVLPFSDFLNLLRAKGYGVGLNEHHTVGRLLERWEGTDPAELGDALAALLARNETEVEGIRRLFDEVHRPPPPTPPPPPPGDWMVFVRGRLWWIAILAALVAWFFPSGWFPPNRLLPTPSPTMSPTPPPPTPSPSVSPPGFSEATPVTMPRPTPPELPARPERARRGAVARAALACFLVAVALLWALKARVTTRRWLTRAWRAELGALPGPYDYEMKVNALGRRLPRADVEDAANLLGRIFSTQTLSRRLDVRRTIRLTLTRDLLIRLAYQPLRAARPIVVLQDVSQDMELWQDKVAAFLGELRRQGVPLERWYFDADVSRVSEGPGAPPIDLAAAEHSRADAPVLVISTGSGLPALMAARDRSWWRALAECPRRAWVTPVADARLWPAELAQVPLHVWPMTGSGLLGAARDLAGIDPGACGHVVEARPTWRQVERMKQLASLVPHPTPDVLELLRQRFAPDVPDAVHEWLFREAPEQGRRELRLEEAELRAQVDTLRVQDPQLEAAVRAQLIALLRESEPALGSAANLRWQSALALQQIALATIRGTDTVVPAATLRVLSQGPLWEEVRQAARYLPDAPELDVALRDAPSVRRFSAVPPSDRGLLGGASPPRAWPGLAEAAGAAVVAALLMGAAWALGRLPTRVLEHAPNAYGLAWTPRVDGAGELELRLADPDQPRSGIALLRDREDAPFRQGLAVGAGTPLRIALGGGDTGRYYRARAVAPDGHLAFSDPLWIPSSDLVVVLIDAQPWAMISIDGPGVSLRPGETPVRVALRAGEYRLQLQNPDFPSPVDTTIRVAPPGGRFAYTMPGFDADRAAGLAGSVAPAVPNAPVVK